MIGSMPSPIASPSSPVILRRVTEGDLRWLAEVAADPRLTGEHNQPGGERDPDAIEGEVRREFLDDGLYGHDRGTLIVCLRDGTRIGDVSWRTEQWGPSSRSRCPAIGINLLPDHRGRGLGTFAQRLLIQFLFERDPSLHRVQSDTAVDNPAERRALAKAGMTEEGVVRHAEFRDGRFHDHILFGVLRDEWTTAAADLAVPNNVDEVIRTHDLLPHPEGGWYHRTYRSTATVPGTDRSISTAILYLLANGQRSHLHRIDADEIWHFHRGDPLDIVELRPDGPALVTRLSADHPQHVVPADTWFGAQLAPGSGYALVGCTVSPGFVFEGFELADRAVLTTEFPHDRALIQELTPEEGPG